MFYVNSRPCNLPQVAKAFNEVYKSYNITQSAFIFANIQLDTNAYDVNVSPDKRTILLHDQTALLESLKEALMNLFEGHDQSVPQAQLPTRKSLTGAFKTPTLVPRDSTESAAVDDRIEPKSAVVRREPAKENGEASPTESIDVSQLPGFVKASLIESFAGRNAEDRVNRAPVRRRRYSSPENDKTTEARVFHPNTRHQSVSPERAREPAAIPPHQGSQSPLFESEQLGSPVPMRSTQPSKAVQDFNARMASQRPQLVERARSPEFPSVTSTGDRHAEEPVPSIKQTPRKSLSQGTIQNAFDRMRPMRTPAQEATITIGDTTTVSTIGSGSQSRSAKRARIHTPRLSLTGTPLDQNPQQPLFIKSLRGFAAPGTQLESSDTDSDGDQDSSMPDQPARSPSPHKRKPSDAFDEPRTDDLAISSCAPPLPRSVLEVDAVDGDSLLKPNQEMDPALGESDDDYVDEDEKKAREEAKIEKLIAEAEEATARPTEANLKRASKLFKVSQNKYQTINLERVIETAVSSISRHLQQLTAALDISSAELERRDLPTSTQLNKEDPEERLSLTVTKKDFNEMRIIGQFNLGFIIAVRPPTSTSPTSDLFIIDQHASDEKYNFERLSTTTTLVSQRLVHPHPLQLTAVEEELILANQHALVANGFIVEMNTADNLDSGQRAKLTSLPMSKEVTFTPTDLEELLALVFDNPPSSSTSTSPHIPRPTKVRKLLASRACRSSVMIGKTLKAARMKEIVRHMGSMDKPWSCPHGRPTMRHLYGLEQWHGWSEGDGVVGVDKLGDKADWAGFLNKHRR